MVQAGIGILFYLFFFKKDSPLPPLVKTKFHCPTHYGSRAQEM